MTVFLNVLKSVRAIRCFSRFEHKSPYALLHNDLFRIEIIWVTYTVTQKKRLKTGGEIAGDWKQRDYSSVRC